MNRDTGWQGRSKAFRNAFAPGGAGAILPCVMPAAMACQGRGAGAGRNQGVSKRLAPDGRNG